MAFNQTRPMVMPQHHVAITVPLQYHYKAAGITTQNLMRNTRDGRSISRTVAVSLA